MIERLKLTYEQWLSKEWWEEGFGKKHNRARWFWIITFPVTLTVTVIGYLAALGIHLIGIKL